MYFSAKCQKTFFIGIVEDDMTWIVVIFLSIYTRWNFNLNCFIVIVMVVSGVIFEFNENIHTCNVAALVFYTTT